MEKKINAVLLSFSGWKLCKLIALIITTATTTENLSCRLIHPTSKLNNSCCLNSVPAANTEASILPKRVIQILRNIWRIFKDLFLDISKFSSHNKDWLFFFFPPKVQVVLYSHPETNMTWNGSYSHMDGLCKKFCVGKYGFVLLWRAIRSGGVGLTWCTQQQRMYQAAV